MLGQIPYTPGMREVLKLSKAEAGRLENDFIGPEHYALALIRKGNGSGFLALAALNIDTADLKEAMEAAVPAGTEPLVGLFEPSPEARSVLQSCREIAGELNYGWVGTEHLLLALVKASDTAPGRFFAEIGVTVEIIEKKTKEILDAGPPNFKRFQELACEWNDREILPEHLLLEVFENSFGKGIELFRRNGQDPENLCDELSLVMRKGTETGDLPRQLSDQARRILESAVAICQQKHSIMYHDIGVLLATAREENGIAGEFLRAHGLTFDKIMATMADL